MLSRSQAAVVSLAALPGAPAVESETRLDNRKAVER